MACSTIVKCFFIDDLKQEHFLFDLTLRETGLPVDCTYCLSVTEAFERLMNGTGALPDFIFVDVSLTGDSGFTFLEEIKRVNRLRHIPVFMYSIIDYPDVRDRALQLGAAAYLVKKNEVGEQALALHEVFSNTWNNREGRAA